MYESDQGIEEFLKRMSPDSPDYLFADDDLDADGSSGVGDADSVGLNPEWLAQQMRAFVDDHPEWEEAIGGFASFLARSDAD